MLWILAFRILIDLIRFLLAKVGLKSVLERFFDVELFYRLLRFGVSV
jgi:hypothetical protein